MKTLFSVLVVVALLAAAVKAVSLFAGTWHATAIGVPAVTLSVLDQDGKISGTNGPSVKITVELFGADELKLGDIKLKRLQ
jgi:hypothetical protein